MSPKHFLHILFVAALAHATPASLAAPSVVRIEKRKGGWQLMRDGQPYFVKGAVVGPGGSLDVLQQAGANSIRTHAGRLDEAHRRGFTALVGLPLGNPRQGFNYADTNKVEQQFNRARDIVRKFRDHPALLFWNLGNEPEIHTTPAQRVPVWREANRLAEMVKREDPNHPVMVVIGGQYADMLHDLNEHCPALDLVGLITQRFRNRRREEGHDTGGKLRQALILQRSGEDDCIHETARVCIV